MATWAILFNGFVILFVLVSVIAIIVDYRKHKDDETISPQELKRLRRNHFMCAMLIGIWILLVHIKRFFA